MSNLYVVATPLRSQGAWTNMQSLYGWTSKDLQPVNELTLDYDIRISKSYGITNTTDIKEAASKTLKCRL